MHCPKCGTELPEGAKFCFNCGEKVDESAIPFWPSETWGSRCRKKAIDFWSRRNSFTKAVIIGMSICSPICMISFLAGKTFAAVCALLQICLFVSAYLMYRQVLRTEKRWLPALLVVLACLLIFPYFGLLRMGMEASGPSPAEGQESIEVTETLQWPESELADRLPEPKSKTGYIQKETIGELSVYVAGTTREDYDGYIAACAEKGFDMLVAREKDSYCVDSGDDYRLTIDYIGEENAMGITIKDIQHGKRYGKTLYADFDLHYLIGKLSAEAEDENTWFLKALCDVKTENGKEENLNCEARVMGTDDNPVVIYFVVY